VCWGILFATGTLQVWHACVLLVLHGAAGSLWGPAEQLMMHDFVGPRELPSAVRLNATFRSLGVLFGPAVGSVLLIGLGPNVGIFVNVAFYLPLTLFLFRTRYTGHSREAGLKRPRIGLVDSVRVLRGVAADHTLTSMIFLAGLASFFLGTALQATMPIFAHDIDPGGGDVGYGVLLFATGAGGVIGGILLETTGLLRPTVPAAVASTVVYALTTVGFALSGSFALAVPLLFIGGVANLAAMSTGQTLVQLRAAPADRGRVVGVYNMSANGLRAGSGLTVGLLGTLIGVHMALGFSAAALCLGALGAGVYAARGRSRVRAAVPKTRTAVPAEK
jgi:MFS family permease